MHSCKKEPDNTSTIPVITFKELAPDSMVVSKHSINVNGVNQQEIDTIYVRFNFTDGDGDLGNIVNRDGEITDSTFNVVYIDDQGLVTDSVTEATINANIFLVDSRTGFVKAYQMPDVSAGANNKVNGEIEILIDDMQCTAFASDTDTVVYSAYIRDREGQQSNIIELDTILIICN